MIKSRRIRWAWHVARKREKMNTYRIFMGKKRGKRPLGRPRATWMDNIRMNLRGIGWDVMDWIDLAQERDQRRALVKTVRNLLVA
jgi:hypothetical protein